MADELLNIPIRLPSADIFSFALTIYEICYSKEQLISNHISLPSEGPLWHTLREGNAEPVKNRPMSLTNLISNCLKVEPELRPTAEDILLINEVRNISPGLERENGSARSDAVILSAATKISPTIQCSSIFFPSIDTSMNNIDMDERAFTPHN
jgi:serine/threonine protein kinase